MINPAPSALSVLNQPNFRIYFALQQVVLMEKARISQGQIFARFDIPTELRLVGKFSIFVDLFTTLIRQSLTSYPMTAVNRLVFITADHQNNQLTLRVTDGGSGLRYQNRQLLRETSNYLTTNFKSLAQLEKILWINFKGKIELHNFATKGTQATITLPAPICNQNLGKF